MKKLIFAFLFLISLIVKGQDTPPTGSYTPVMTTGYYWLRGAVKEGFTVPAGASPIIPLKTWRAAGLVYVDSVANKFYFWSSNAWHDAAGVIDTTGFIHVSDSLIYYPFRSNPLGYLKAGDIVKDNAVLSGGLVTRVGGLVINISPSTIVYNNLILSFPSTNFTLGTADATNPRFDGIYYDATGPHIAAGTPSTPAAFPDIDPTNITWQYIFVPATVTDLTTSNQLMIRDEAAGGEWTISKTVTSTDNYGTNPYLVGSISQRVTAAANNTYLRWTGTTQSKATWKYLILAIRLNATFNNARNIVLRLQNTGVQAPGTAPLTLTNQRNFVKTTVGAYMIVTVLMSDFGGSDLFNQVEGRFTGTGGTVDIQFDKIRLQSDTTNTATGVVFGVIGGNVDDQINLRDSLRTKLTGVTRSHDTVYNNFYNGSKTFAFKDSTGLQASINDFKIAKSRTTTGKHSAFGRCVLLNGIIVNVIAEGNQHANDPGRIPVSYHSSDHGRSFQRTALSLVGLTATATDDLDNIAGGVMSAGDSAYFVITRYVNASNVHSPWLLLEKTTNGSTFTNPVRLVYDTTVLTELTAYGKIEDMGSYVLVPCYGSKAGGVSVPVVLKARKDGVVLAAYEVDNGDNTLGSNYLTEMFIQRSPGTNTFIAMVRREQSQPAFYYSTNACVTWSAQAVLAVGDSVNSTFIHAPDMYVEGSTMYALFSDRINGNVVRIENSADWTSVSDWNASPASVVAPAIVQNGSGAYNFGYTSTIGTGENRMLAMYDIDIHNATPADIGPGATTQLIIYPLPLTPRPVFMGQINNSTFPASGVTENTLVFERTLVNLDTKAMLQKGDTSFIVKEDGMYLISGNLRIEPLSFAEMAQLTMYLYDPWRNPNDLTRAVKQGINIGQGATAITFSGTRYLMAGQKVIFRLYNGHGSARAIVLDDAPVFSFVLIPEQ